MLSVPSIIAGVLLVVFTAFSLWRTFSPFEIGSEKRNSNFYSKRKSRSGSFDVSAGTLPEGKEKKFVLDAMTRCHGCHQQNHHVLYFAIYHQVHS